MMVSRTGFTTYKLCRRVRQMSHSCAIVPTGTTRAAFTSISSRLTPVASFRWILFHRLLIHLLSLSHIPRRSAPSFSQYAVPVAPVSRVVSEPSFRCLETDGGVAALVPIEGDATTRPLQLSMLPAPVSRINRESSTPTSPQKSPALNQTNHPLFPLSSPPSRTFKFLPLAGVVSPPTQPAILLCHHLLSRPHSSLLTPNLDVVAGV